MHQLTMPHDPCHDRQVILGNDRGDGTLILGSIQQDYVMVKPYALTSNNTYNLTLVDPPEYVCVDSDITPYGLGDCGYVHTFITGIGFDCADAISGLPDTLRELCRVTCGTCPARSSNNRRIRLLPSLNNNPLADPLEPVKILTSVSNNSILTRMATLVEGSINTGFGSIVIDAQITTTGRYDTAFVLCFHCFRD